MFAFISAFQRKIIVQPHKLHHCHQFLFTFHFVKTHLKKLCHHVPPEKDILWSCNIFTARLKFCPPLPPAPFVDISEIPERDILSFLKFCSLQPNFLAHSYTLDHYRERKSHLRFVTKNISVTPQGKVSLSKENMTFFKFRSEYIKIWKALHKSQDRDCLSSRKCICHRLRSVGDDLFQLSDTFIICIGKAGLSEIGCFFRVFCDVNLLVSWI